MNIIDKSLLKEANREAIYIIFLYLAHKISLNEKESLKNAVKLLKESMMQSSVLWSEQDKRRLSILQNVCLSDDELKDAKIENLTLSKSSLSACTFTNKNGEMSFVFKGTGSGEWIDNGEGLSGIPEENTYITYKKSGSVLSRKTVFSDYTTDQQADALNWFNSVLSKTDSNRKITVSGHSKGGNKAQFIAVHSEKVSSCFSFDGQGFSPEAIDALKLLYKADFQNRIKKIHSLSAENDYVNVLGERLMPENQIYYFKSSYGIHSPEAILNEDGTLSAQSKQGKISRYAEIISKDLMNIPPSIRKFATLGIMNIFQKYLGEGSPVNNDSVSAEETIAGLGVAIGPILHLLSRMKNSN